MNQIMMEPPNTLRICSSCLLVCLLVVGLFVGCLYFFFFFGGGGRGEGRGIPLFTALLDV